MERTVTHIRHPEDLQWEVTSLFNCMQSGRDWSLSYMDPHAVKRQAKNRGLADKITIEPIGMR